MLGDTYYTPSLHRIWIKIYSRMLKTILPVAVSCELRGSANEEEDGVSVTRRDGASMFHHGQAASSSEDEHLHLESQKIINSHKESKGQIRPPSGV